MPTGNLPQSVMTFFIISWASVFLQCEFKCCVSPRSQSPCGSFPVLDWWFHDITFGRGFGLWHSAYLKSAAVGQGTGDTQCPLSFWEILCPAGWGQRHNCLVCVSVCSPLDLSGMNNAWKSYGAEGETISSSTLIKKMLGVTLSLSIWWRCSSEINKMQTNVFLTNRLLHSGRF